MDVINNTKLLELTSSMEKVNPAQQSSSGANLDNEIFEI
jgi:hypothetical protein